jgi:antitoxin HicB
MLISPRGGFDINSFVLCCMTRGGVGAQSILLRYTYLHMSRREFVTAHQNRYTVLFEPAEEGGYVVTYPSLPGLVTEGDTLEEVRAMAAEAIRGYSEALANDGQPIPPEDPQPGASIIAETVSVAIEEA